MRSPLIFLSTRAAVETKREQKVRLLLHVCPRGLLSFSGQTAYEAVLDIIKREGFLGLYSGLNSSLLGIAITNGCVSRSLL